jgi:hypothetical protein
MGLLSRRTNFCYHKPCFLVEVGVQAIIAPASESLNEDQESQKYGEEQCH